MIKAINVINTGSLENKEIGDLIKFYNSYDDKKFEIVIVIPKEDEIKNKLKEAKLKIIEVEGLEKSIWNFQTLNSLIKIFREEKPEIIHTYENRIAQIGAKFVKDCKVIFTGNDVSETSKNKILKIKKIFWNEILADRVSTFYEIFSKEEKNTKKDDKKLESDVYTEQIQNLYETLEREPKMKKINLLDIFIILIVLMACTVGYKFIKGTDNVITSSTNKIIYQVRTSETLDEVYDMVEVGTPIYESRKNYYIGTIIDKQSEKSVRYAMNTETGEYVASEIDGCTDIILTIEADAQKGLQNIMIQDFELKVGSEAFIKGKGYAALGYVISIER